MSVVAVLVGGACGDNTLPVGEPLSPAAHLTIVVHPDDDLLFMQPDLQDALNRGEGMTSVYVTASNDTKGLDYVENRYAGLMAAYGAIAGTHDWNCGWIDIADHAAEHCRLDEVGISLVFLGYPDGGLMGERPTSLRNLWQGTIVRGGELCALTDAGVVGVGQGATGPTEVRSTWPDRRAPLWFADLDGDHLVDWCSATPAGPACSLGAHRELTTDGVPWGFASAA